LVERTVPVRDLYADHGLIAKVEDLEARGVVRTLKGAYPIHPLSDHHAFLGRA
jgi:hypothetical protein